MYNNAVSESPWVLEYVPERYKTQEMCENVLSKVNNMVTGYGYGYGNGNIGIHTKKNNMLVSV